MKNYKILENRPELTNEQVVKGMDFNKIKNNATSAKPGLFNSTIIKGILGAIVICASVLIYKNIKPNEEQKTQVAVADTTIATITNKTDSSTIVTETTIIEKSTNTSVYKSIANKTLATKSLGKDSNAVKEVATYNPVVKPNIGGYNTRDFAMDNENEKRKPQEQLRTIPGECNIKEINKTTAKVNETLYASQVEVTNKLYNTFLNSIKKLNSKAFVSIAEIDSVRWRDKNSYNEPYVQYYHTHPAYNNYPVVNISYEGAKLFCEWLTLQYNSSPKRKFNKVIVRLPSEEEWTMAAQAGNKDAIYSWQGKELRNKKGQILANFIGDVKDSLWIDGKGSINADVTAPVNSYWKNNFGIYNMSGNVAEMIDVKGIAKGGSWRNNSESLKIDEKYKYDGKPQVSVGFRYFIEVVEK